VPAYDYAAVHVRGRLRTFDDPARLGQLLRALVERHEAAFPEPWRMDDAPPEYVRERLRAMVGIEIRVTQMEGKWKVSQHRPAADREFACPGAGAVGGGGGEKAGQGAGRGPGGPPHTEPYRQSGGGLAWQRGQSLSRRKNGGGFTWQQGQSLSFRRSGSGLDGG